MNEPPIAAQTIPTFATPGPIAATVSVAGARVRVTASDRSDTAVLVAPIDSASPSDVRVAETTKVAFAKGHLTVKTTRSGANEGSVAITIDMPAGSSLVAYTSHSTVQTSGPLGDCELHIASSRVRLERVDALQANIAAGEVEVGHIAGQARVQGSAAEVRIGEVVGEVRLSGRVLIGNPAGSDRLWKFS